MSVPNVCDRETDPGLLLLARPYDHPDATALVHALYEEQRQRYGQADPPEADPRAYEPAGGLFLVGYVEGQAVACGGYRSYEPGTVEVKKMYVRREFRGHGYGQRILAALEETASANGAERVILETGVKNTEAISLYTSAGYTRISSYSIYGARPRNRAFAKILEKD